MAAVGGSGVCQLHRPDPACCPQACPEARAGEDGPAWSSDAALEELRLPPSAGGLVTQVRLRLRVTASRWCGVGRSQLGMALVPAT